MGEVDTYLARLGVTHRSIATRNPRANGQVERFNRSLEAGLRRFATAAPSDAWDEHLADVLRGLRLMPTRATGFSPYVLVYKQSPQLPLPVALRSEVGESL